MSKHPLKAIVYSFISLSFTFILSFKDSVAAELQHKLHVDYSPAKKAVVPYGGVEHKDSINGVKVASCVSLGGLCINRINMQISHADEFVVLFMYRLNSPILIRTLEDLNFNKIPVIVFLDHEQTYKDSEEKSGYSAYVKQLINTVPTSLVKLGSRPFHQKVIITKKKKEQAVVILGSANATFESENVHSEDILLIQSNKLAHYFMEAFENLMRMEPPQRVSATTIPEQRVKVFHEHRVEQGKSNIDRMSNLKSLLNIQDELTMDSYWGNVTSFAISTGFSSDDGTLKCLNILNSAFEAPDNQALFLFENFISLNAQLLQGQLGKNLKNKTPKLIVLDDNEDNQRTVGSLTAENNKTLLFKPFTGGKFHHKLVIQYSKDHLPIVYTGSFHFSVNAIERNSENVIGVQSKALADEYLASILLNSGLGEHPQVWTSIYEFRRFLLPRRGPSTTENPKLLMVAKKISKKCKTNMERYLDRLDRIESNLKSAAKDADEQIDIGKHFEHCTRQFEKGNSNEKLAAIIELKDSVFSSTLKKIYLNSLDKCWTRISKKLDELEELPTYSKGMLNEWLQKIDTWLKNVKEDFSKKEINGVKDELLLIEDIYKALFDLNEYEYSFSLLVELDDILSKILES